MWFERVLPDLRRRRLGSGLLSRTLRLTGIGESQVADLLGEARLRRANPEIATYARADAVDVRLSASDRPGRSAAELLDGVEADVLAQLGDYVWARGSTTWPEAIAAELERLDWTLAIRETGTDAALATLLGGLARLRRAESLPGAGARKRSDVRSEARSIALEAGATVGLAVDARARGDDMVITIGVATPLGLERERRLGFLGGAQGRTRAALLAAAALLPAAARGERLSDRRIRRSTGPVPRCGRPRRSSGLPPVGQHRPGPGPPDRARAGPRPECPHQHPGGR